MPDITTPKGAFEASQRFYETNAHQYAENTADLVNSDLVDFVSSLKEGAVVLDAGCGPGRDLERLAEWGYQAVGVDLAGTFCDMASAFAPVIQADLRNLPLKDQSVDGVWACASLVHLNPDDAKLALSELWRVLRMDAITEISVKTEGSSGWAGPKGHERWFQSWSPRPLCALVESCGMSVTWCKIQRGFVVVRARAR